jgi:hypothetical protein
MSIKLPKWGKEGNSQFLLNVNIIILCGFVLPPPPFGAAIMMAGTFPK